jgi:hypothetical protein
MFNIAVNSLFAFFFFEDQLRQQKKRLSTQRKTMLFRETLHTRFSIPIVAFPVSKKKKNRKKKCIARCVPAAGDAFPPRFRQSIQSSYLLRSPAADNLSSCTRAIIQLKQDEKRIVVIMALLGVWFLNLRSNDSSCDANGFPFALRLVVLV